MRGRTWTQDEIVAFFARQKFLLISTYRKANLPIEYKCSCGKIAQISLDGLKQRLRKGKPACSHKRKVAFTLKEVRDFFAEHGCILITDTYTGCNQRLTYQCSCGRQTAETNFRIFKHKGGGHCRLCIREGISSRSQKTMRDPKVLAKQRETFRRNYGVDNPLQNPGVKQKREQTCLKRYGVRSVNQDPEIKARQRASFRAKYGVDHFMQNPDSLARYRKTLLDRYGVPSLAFLSGRSSIEAQRFFTALFDLLPKAFQGKCYFSPRTHEFNVWFQGKYYKYDFVQSHLKRVIEYNGSRFHPSADQTPDEIGWCLFRPTRTVQEARDYEQHKLDALRNRGFGILIVWDYEAKHNLDSTLQKCLAFLGVTPKS